MDVFFFFFFFFGEKHPYVLMDDLGGNPFLFGQAATGTDPQQGAALARAMLEVQHAIGFLMMESLNQFLP